MASRNTELLDEVAKKCKTLGAEGVLVLKCDVSKEEDCKSLVRSSVEKFGGIDILVLNAGVTMNSFVEDVVDRSIYKTLMDTNYFGCINPTLEALPEIIKAKGTIAVGWFRFSLFLVPIVSFFFYYICKCS